MKYLSSLLIVAATFTACTDDMDIPPNDNSMIVKAVVEDIKDETKDIITGNAFPNGSHIGVTVLNTSGSAYDGMTYSNIKFTLNTSSWSGASTVYLSSTAGTAYAYYPWVSSADITALAITAPTGLASSGTDYMYATAQSVSQTARSVTFPMKHALAAVEVIVKKGSYTGTGKVTACTWRSASAGTSGKLNAKTGALSNQAGASTTFDTGLTSSAALTASTAGTTYTFMCVPMAAAGAPTFNLTMDGQAYSVSGASITFESGNKYVYTLTMNSKTLSLSAVHVTAWASGTTASLTPTF